MASERPINRRTVLRALAGSGGALFLASCAREIALPTPTPLPSPTVVTTPFPTATFLPTITPTPDLSDLWAEIESYFPISARLATQAIPEGQALLALVGGQTRAVALDRGDGWLINVPLPPEEMNQQDPSEIFTYQRELAAAGYGMDLRLQASGPGREGIEAIPESDDLVYTDCYGDFYQRRVDEGAPSLRWAGQAWVPGVVSDGKWSPGLPDFVDGTEDLLDGSFMVTVDDCHYEEPLTDILDVLDELGVKATFFPNTPNLTLFPEPFRRMVEAGHEIGYHTTLHRDWSPAYLKQDRPYFESVVREITGMAEYHLRAVRPPFGWWDQGGWMDDSRSAGLTTVMWGRSVSEDAYDWSIDAALADYHSHILLAHARPTDAAWFRQNLAYLRDLRESYVYRTVTEALLVGAEKVAIVGLPNAYSGV